LYFIGDPSVFQFDERLRDGSRKLVSRVLIEGDQPRSAAMRTATEFGQPCQDVIMTATTMIFLHGPGQTPPNWQGVIDHIDPEQPMFAPWIKGMKPTDSDEFEMAAAAADVANTVEMRGLEQIDLIGISLGGMVALRAAADYPKMIRHLIVMSVPVTPPASQLKAQRLMLKLMPESQFKDAPKAQVLAALDALIGADMHDFLKKISAPTLVITAEGDANSNSGAPTLIEQTNGQLVSVPYDKPNLLDAPTPVQTRVAQLVMNFCADRPLDTPIEKHTDEGEEGSSAE
jgi:pimeloyl-ACP methyl ester carboxylesterase